METRCPNRGRVASLKSIVQTDRYADDPRSHRPEARTRGGRPRGNRGPELRFSGSPAPNPELGRGATVNRLVAIERPSIGTSCRPRASEQARKGLMRSGAVEILLPGPMPESQEGAQHHGLSGNQRRHADHDRLSGNAGGARGLDGSGFESGCVKGSTPIASSVIGWIDGSLEKVTGNCPCAKKWQMRQPSIVSRPEGPESPGMCPFEAGPIECDEPLSSCRHGPHSVTAAWHAISVANRSCLTNRDMIFPIRVYSPRSTKTQA